MSRPPGAGGRARLTARDYKGSQPRSLNLRRLRDFAWGAAVGVAAASVMWVYGGARLRHVEEPVAPRPDPHRATHPEGGQRRRPSTTTSTRCCRTSRSWCRRRTRR